MDDNVQEFKMIVAEYGWYSLETEINTWLRQGWRLHGPLHFEPPSLVHTQGVFYQALVLPKNQ